MNRESLARTTRLLEIRTLQRQAAQSSLARAEQHARQAERIARDAERRLDEAAQRAVLSGELTVDDLVDARSSFAFDRLAQKAAEAAAKSASQARATRHDQLRSADLAVRQIEHLAESELSALRVEDGRRERILADETAARRTGR